MRIPHSALRQRMLIYDYAGEGAYGPSFGAERGPIHASVQQTQSVATDWKNESVNIDTMAIVRPEDGPVAAGSRVVVDGETYRVVKSFAMPDGFRPTHHELMLVRWEEGN